jgi:hypothetical protein
MSSRKVLMLTNSEFGQANVFIATTHALLESNPDVEIHIASFPSFEQPARRALTLSGTSTKNGDTPTYHALPGRTMFECLGSDADPANRIFSVSLLKPGFRNSPCTAKFILTKGFTCWSPEEFAAIFAKICTLIEEISPDVVIVDQILSPGLTAAKHMKETGPRPFKIAILSPNSLKDYVHHLEPRAAVFWKWPVVGSGLTMPMSFASILLNIYLMFRLIGVVISDKKVPEMRDRVRKLTHLPQLELTTNATICHDGLSGIDKVLVGSRPEVDFPSLDLVNPPRAYLDKLVGCGPILRPFVQVENELLTWLKRGPVVYINLGTHCLTSEAEAVEMARSLKTLIGVYSARNEEKSTLRVLWKIKKDLSRGDDFGVGPGTVLFDVLGHELEKDQVRIVNWLDSEPNSVLNTGNIICAVSHGGANSFYEAVW